jgi:hypothetical protein
MGLKSHHLTLKLFSSGTGKNDFKDVWHFRKCIDDPLFSGLNWFKGLLAVNFGYRNDLMAICTAFQGYCVNLVKTEVIWM